MKPGESRYVVPRTNLSAFLRKEGLVPAPPCYLNHWTKHQLNMETEWSELPKKEKTRLLDAVVEKSAQESAAAGCTLNRKQKRKTRKKMKRELESGFYSLEDVRKYLDNEKR